MSRAKIIRDPVHGFVEIPREHILPLVDTWEFQRLRRLTQLGTTSFTYPGGEHSRFQHSLGVAHLFGEVARELKSRGTPLTEEEHLVGMCAALLHDVGHAPFSHALEGVLVHEKDHEEWTQEIILAEDTAVNQRLREIDTAMPQKVADVIGQRPPNTVLVSLISSQLDVDRMDFLLRDSVFVGAPYGRYDVQRLTKMLVRDGENIVVDERGLMNVQEYLFARYYMYWQVYFHITTRGYECLLKAAWRRARDLHTDGHLDPEGLTPALKAALEATDSALTLQQYLALDNYDIYAAIKVWASNSDSILADLCRRLLGRNLLKPIDITDVADVVNFEKGDAIRDLIREADFNPKYYLLLDRSSDMPYDYYTVEEEASGKQPIYVRNRNGRLREIARESDAIGAVARQRTVRIRMYVPEECRLDIQELIFK